FFISIVHEQDHEAYTKGLNATVIGEAYQARYRFYHQSGMEMWADTRTVPIYSEDGTLISSLSITLDVTGAVRQQKQVEEKNRDLEDFSYMISHDLKAPIYTIKGMIQILKEDFKDLDNQEFMEPVDHIEKATLRLEQLVASVLEYSRVTTIKSEEGPVELSEVFKDIQNDFMAHLKSTNSKLSVPPELPIVLGDRLKIYQIFANLVGNAIKYRAKDRPLIIEISHNKSKNNRHTIIAVQDNGSGIPKEKRQAVFRPFQRAHGKDIEGSGIGLACVRKLLEKLGGDIWLESEEQRGSTFYVQLRNNESYL
ncbi:MAG: PAS domain-containing protein, partial [Bdellovibrionales bacterium]|nr:PAS domain-containing protein [Bdellovibrionales bacterium]